MTQAKIVGSGTNVKYIATATQYPTDRTITATPTASQLGRRTYLFDGAATTSEDIEILFVAEENGYIDFLSYANGAVAIDGSVGWELDFTNNTNSDARLGYFGFGSGTEAVKATIQKAALAANTPWTLKNTLPDIHGYITGVTVASPGVVTSAAHGLVTGDEIVVTGSDSVPTLDGLRSVTKVDANTFTLNVNTTVAGTKGRWYSAARFNKGDQIHCIGDRDGTTGVGTFSVGVVYDGRGRNLTDLAYFT